MKPLYIGEAGEQPDAVAPDGIPIHLVLCDFHTAGQEAALGPMRFLGLAEARIGPGEWGVHAHGSLEQVSYVLEGEVVVHTRDSAGGELQSVRLRQGQAIVTLPTQTLSFANPGKEVARVLFICAPPYPADDSDTFVLHPRGTPDEDATRTPEEGHRPLTDDEIAQAIQQHERAKEQMHRVLSERVTTLRRLLHSRRSVRG